LTAEISPEQREVQYERKLQQGMQVCLAHTPAPTPAQES
jgi:hypothetical protein